MLCFMKSDHWRGKRGFSRGGGEGVARAVWRWGRAGPAEKAASLLLVGGPPREALLTDSVASLLFFLEGRREHPGGVMGGPGCQPGEGGM